ncbi:MAG TPA: NAD(P)/FAD-dependent oxidoreductase [Gemmataceae bacterium]|nr:NAD(P)/FAD-dependent oxidoreductase [Gemmataceae bacterium]
MSNTPHFTIVGSGLAGTLLACYLGKAGYRVDLHEKRSDPRLQNAERGRSINLALSVRGIQALREVGLADEILQQAIPMRGRMIHSRGGALIFQPYGKDDSESINSVSRAGLNLALIQAAARYDSIRMFFNHRCTGIDLATATLDIHDDVANQTSKLPCEIVIGADGAYSAVRAAMQRHERFNYQQSYLSHGYKELSIPPGPGGTFLMERHALHIWPRHSFMMIALPNLDGSFTCTLFWPYEGENSFAALRNDDDIRRFFAEQFADAAPLMPDLVEQYRANPIGPLLTVRCLPWHLGGKVALLGDACHALVPFLGQGMNAAFEDCTVLDRCIRAHAPKWEAAFAHYETERKENTDALADMAIDNFLEMRDRVSSRLFLWKKWFHLLLHKLLPRWYLPLYTLVTFTTTPYAVARRRAQQQERIVRWLLASALLIVLVFLLWMVWR